MAKATLSILGMYNWDSTIFDNMVLPSEIDKDIVIENILMECSDFSVIYPDLSFLKFAIGSWSKKELKVWEDLYKTTVLEYNPIHNYDRKEETTDTELRDLHINNNETRNLTGTNNETRNLSGTDNQTRNLQNSKLETRNLNGSNDETRNIEGSEEELRNLSNDSKHKSETSGTTKNEGEDITKESVAGFNVDTPTLAKQVENQLGSGNKSTGKIEYTTENIDTGNVDKTFTDKGTVKHAITDKGTINNTDTDTGTINRNLSDNGTIRKDLSDIGTIRHDNNDTGTVTRNHTMRAYGNIGVTTSQQMIEAERNVVKFNVIDYIIDSFKCRFCLLIY